MTFATCTAFVLRTIRHHHRRRHTESSDLKVGWGGKSGRPYHWRVRAEIPDAKARADRRAFDDLWTTAERPRRRGGIEPRWNATDVAGGLPIRSKAQEWRWRWGRKGANLSEKERIYTHARLGRGYTYYLSKTYILLYKLRRIQVDRFVGDGI